MLEKQQDRLRRIANDIHHGRGAEINYSEFLFQVADHIDELETQLKMMNRIVSSDIVPTEEHDSRFTVIEHRITMLEQRLHSVPTILDIESFMMGRGR